MPDQDSKKSALPAASAAPGAGKHTDRDSFRTSPPGRQIIVIVVIVVALYFAIHMVKSRAEEKDKQTETVNALNPNQALVTKAAADAVELKTAAITMEPGKRTIKTNGVVHFSPYSTINVSPRLVGKVRNVFVKVGDHVVTGQPLVEMVSTDASNAFDTARNADEQLKLTTSALDIARKQFKLGTPEVQSAEAAFIQAHEASLFNKKQLDLTSEQNKIGGFIDKPLTDAQSAEKQTSTQLAQDEKDQALAQKQYDRAVKLFSIGTATKQDVETSEDTLGKAKDAVSNDREQLRIAQLTLAREQKAYNSKLYANQNLAQAENNYKQALIAEQAAATALKMAKAALYHDLKQAEHDFNTAVSDDHAAHIALRTYDDPTRDGVIIIKAPAAGVITARNVNPGQIVDQTGQTPWQMITIVNAKTVYVDAQVYEKDMIGVRVNDRVSAKSDALPAGFVSNGRISFVSPGLDPASHALSVRADLDNQSGLLKDGMFVATSIDISAHSPFPALPIVPLTAVVHDGDSDYVYVSAGKDKYDRRKVTLGEQRGEGQVAITQGLTGTETIVTHGALYLGAGGTTLD